MSDDIHPDSQDDSALAYTAGQGDRAPDLARELLSAIEQTARRVVTVYAPFKVLDAADNYLYTKTYSQEAQAVAFVALLHETLMGSDQPAIRAAALALEALRRR